MVSGFDSRKLANYLIMEIRTDLYLKGFNQKDMCFNPPIGRDDFVTRKRIEINKLISNQEYIDKDTLEHKIKGYSFTMPHVLEFKNELILMDGNHTVIAKLLRGQKDIYCLYLKR